MKDKFKYINATAFFADYLPKIKSYKHKIRGKNGRGNAIDFSEEEKKQIKLAVSKMMSEF